MKPQMRDNFGRFQKYATVNIKKQLEKTDRFKSIYNDHEPFLLEKTNTLPDNITKYLVEWKR